MLVFFLTFGCGSSQINNSGPLFLNMALQDSLVHYISQVPEIENPYHAPTIMDICIKLNENDERSRRDTIVSISAVYEILQGPVRIDTSIVSGENEGTILGACIVNGRMCVVKKAGKIDISCLLDEKRLTLSREKYDFFYQYEGPIYDVGISRSTREYKLNGKNQVVLIGKTIGIFERP